MILVLACGWALVVFGLILRAAGQRGLFEPSPATAAPPLPPAPVAVIVPARNEAAIIGACLDGLLAQDYPPALLRVLVVDDHSDDATFSIAAVRARTDPRLEALRSPPLPGGWVGKCHACWIGASAAQEADWLCFIDADVRVEADLLTSAVAAARAQRLDLLSLAPRQELGSFAERLVMPCGLYIMAVRQNLAHLQSPASDDATVTGQFILVRRRAYCNAGGHRAVRAEIAEDVALGRLLKRAGARVALRDGAGLLRARMYAGWRSLAEGVSKNLVDMLGGIGPTLAVAVLATTLSWGALVVPALCAAAAARQAPSARPALLIALAASASLVGLHVAGARHFRIPLWYGLLFPLGYTAGALIAIDSVRRRLSGRIVWKGRTYP